MSVSDYATERRLYRDRDSAMLAGVCAGIAAFLGFNLTATRLVAVVALFATGPIFVVAYIAAALLIPVSDRETPFDRNGEYKESRRDRRHRRRAERLRRKAERYESYREKVAEKPEISARAQIIREKCADLDTRLQILERHVTSKKFQIEQELSRL